MIHKPTTDITRAMITVSNTAATTHIIEASIGIQPTIMGRPFAFLDPDQGDRSLIRINFVS